MLTWREAMERALYGPGGFFVSGEGPAAHFRTSATASSLFGRAITRLAVRVDAALGHPDPFTITDIGAGQGELLRGIADLLPTDVRARAQFIAVERAPRPPDLPDYIEWRSTPVESVTGLLLAMEWLDNVPIDIAALDPGGTPRRVMVDPRTGEESLGEPLTDDETAWLERWWPGFTTSPRREAEPGCEAAAAPEAPPASERSADSLSPTWEARQTDRPDLTIRAEIGAPRDAAWAEAVATVERGLALAVDYGHLAESRPVTGTLTGYRYGRQVPPVPDGSCDLTAHVAMDSVAAAGAAVAGADPILTHQREALTALGVSGRRPPLTLASANPTEYVRALAAASHAAELLDPAGLGGHWWLYQPVGVPPTVIPGVRSAA